MHILPILALVLLIGMLTGANLFALGACSLLIVFQLTRFYANRWAGCLTVERQLTNSELQIGDSLAVGMRLNNDTGYYIPWLFAEDLLSKRVISEPNRALEITGYPAKLYFFRPRQIALMTYQIKALRRGYFQLGPTILETGDLLGLHRNYRVASEPHYILVLPKLVPLQGMNISSRRPMGDLHVNDRVMEDPTQMVGIREYRAGDSLNRIHWRATARTGKLHTRVFQPTCIQGAMLVLDMHIETNPDRNEPVRTDLAVTMAASLAHTLYMMNQPFGLVSNGRDAVDRVRQMRLERDFSDRSSVRADVEMNAKSNRLRPVVVDARTGPEQFAEVHRTLARLERTDGLRFENLLMETQYRLSRQLSVLVIVQQVGDSMALALGLLRRRGFAVSAIVNQHEKDGLQDSVARLVAYHIPVFALPDEAAIA
ncbi:MAG TPA: DUF58 domain-containing protein, partial [Pirellula sp.]|nr:DUF58 domain-containing protein [Pirellula sp.]